MKQPSPRGLRGPLNPSTWGLFPRLLLYLLGVAVVPLVVVSTRTELETRAVLAEIRRDRLATLAETLGRSLDIYLSERQRGLTQLAALPALRTLARDDAWSDAPRTAAAQDVLRTLAGSSVATTASMVDRSGIVRLSTDPRLVGQNLGALASVQAALRGGGSSGDLSAEGAQQAGLRSTAPVVGESGTTVGALVLRASPDELWALMADLRAGGSSRTILVDERGLIIGDSRDRSKLFTPLIEPGFGAAARPGVSQEPGPAAAPAQWVEAIAGLMHSDGEVVAARRLSSQAWTVLVVQDEGEAFVPLAVLQDATRLTVLVVLLLASVVAAIAALSIASPIRRMRAVLAAAAEGDLSQRVRVDRRDELGRLGEQVDGTLDALTTLAGDAGAAADAASATSAQVAAASQQQAAAVAQIAATVEELARSAEQVAESAESTLRSAEHARGNVVAGVQSLDHIKERSDALADRLAILADISQRIGDVADLIGDITNKTHLLSVNAAIEAASAGEFGRRFAVVAQQVKQLADETRDAAGEVKQLIRQTQTASSAAVLAAEEVAREVGVGVGVAREADQAIEAMVHQVRTISLATQQQLTANRQVADAVIGTSDAVQAVAQALGGLEQRVRGLRQRLDELNRSPQAPRTVAAREHLPVPPVESRPIAAISSD